MVLFEGQNRLEDVGTEVFDRLDERLYFFDLLDVGSLVRLHVHVQDAAIVVEKNLLFRRLLRILWGHRKLLILVRSGRVKMERLRLDRNRLWQEFLRNTDS